MGTLHIRPTSGPSGTVVSLSGPACFGAAADFHDSYNLSNAKSSDGVGLHYIRLSRSRSDVAGRYEIRLDDTSGRGMFELLCSSKVGRNFTAFFTVTK